jgi:hypothetical protein
MPSFYTHEVHEENAQERTPIKFLSRLHHHFSSNCAIVTKNIVRTRSKNQLQSIHIQFDGFDVTVEAKDLPDYLDTFKANEETLEPMPMNPSPWSYTSEPLVMAIIRDNLDKQNLEEGKPPFTEIVFGEIMHHPMNRDVCFVGYNIYSKLGDMNTSKVIRKRKPVTA